MKSLYRSRLGLKQTKPFTDTPWEASFFKTGAVIALFQHESCYLCPGTIVSVVRCKIYLRYIYYAPDIQTQSAKINALTDGLRSSSPARSGIDITSHREGCLPTWLRNMSLYFNFVTAHNTAFSMQTIQLPKHAFILPTSIPCRRYPGRLKC